MNKFGIPTDIYKIKLESFFFVCFCSNYEMS